MRARCSLPFSFFAENSAAHERTVQHNALARRSLRCLAGCGDRPRETGAEGNVEMGSTERGDWTSLEGEATPATATEPVPEASIEGLAGISGVDRFVLGACFSNKRRDSFLVVPVFATTVRTEKSNRPFDFESTADSSCNFWKKLESTTSPDFKTLLLRIGAIVDCEAVNDPRAKFSRSSCLPRRAESRLTLTEIWGETSKADFVSANFFLDLSADSDFSLPNQLSVSHSDEEIV